MKTEIGVLREALEACVYELDNHKRCEQGWTNQSVVSALKDARAALASVPAKPQVDTLKAVDGEFYNGMEWLGAWLVDHAEGETITEELVQQWAVEAWRKYTEQKPEPQVDTTLERALAKVNGLLRDYDHRSEVEIELSEISYELAHARKSQPTQGVKRDGLLPCPFCGGVVCRDHSNDSYHEDISCATCGLSFRISNEDWNTRAESAAVPNLELELAEALREASTILHDIAREDLNDVEEVTSNTADKFDAILARFDARKTEEGK